MPTQTAALRFDDATSIKKQHGLPHARYRRTAAEGVLFQQRRKRTDHDFLGTHNLVDQESHRRDCRDMRRTARHWQASTMRWYDSGVTAGASKQF